MSRRQRKWGRALAGAGIVLTFSSSLLWAQPPADASWNITTMGVPVLLLVGAVILTIQVLNGLDERVGRIVAEKLGPVEKRLEDLQHEIRQMNHGPTHQPEDN